MPVRSEPLINGRTAADAAADVEFLNRASRRAPLNANKAAAAIIWLAGAAATYVFIASLIGDAPWWLSAVVAVATQAVLTIGERGITRGRMTPLRATALAFDVLLNAGGLYQPLKNIGNTQVGAMLADVTGNNIALNGLTAFVLSAIIGVFIALAPEDFWSR